MSDFDIDFDAVETFTAFSRTQAARLIGAFSAQISVARSCCVAPSTSINEHCKTPINGGGENFLDGE